MNSTRQNPSTQTKMRKAPWLALALTGLVAFVLLAPLASPYDPYAIDILGRLDPISARHWLGTDQMGRDVLSRLLFGARLTTLSALCVVFVSVVLGCCAGAIAGYFGGLPDRLLMRLCEGISVLPALAIAMVIAGILGLGLKAVILALAAVHWTEYARLIRNIVIVERSKAYVMAAESLGVRPVAILRRHLFPNIAAPILTLCTFSLSWVILAFAGLSFLGLGVEAGTPEWGRMIADSRSHMRAYPRLVLAPGLTIMSFVIAVNLLGDALGDHLRGSRTNHLN
ncbi:ABC transporter permease [Cohaesibacter celericrescens]|uniref:ABC transporter permease n=1 Tax=Cohaesibacter celericrescens TaxID=2067669 RepID=A0A2N5XRQ4_9HYPH|nr:ABC transporter permease subunit [Cohaesibacter celericrescens]PLW77202.1 ABC transporter permease [Cohaesibacter celericrescens]